MNLVPLKAKSLFVEVFDMRLEVFPEQPGENPAFVLVLLDLGTRDGIAVFDIGN
jgi:hypothetical protein